jgi:hypothetical protein
MRFAESSTNCSGPAVLAAGAGADGACATAVVPNAASERQETMAQRATRDVFAEIDLI